MNGICAVGQLLCLSEAVFVCSKAVTLGFLCVIEAACTLEENLKFRIAFGSFNSCCAVIAVLDESNSALYNVLGNGKSYGIYLNGIILRLCADLVNGIVELITL